jgi:hypothetical protein
MWYWSHARKIKKVIPQAMIVGILSPRMVKPIAMRAVKKGSIIIMGVTSWLGLAQVALD